MKLVWLLMWFITCNSFAASITQIPNYTMASYDAAIKQLYHSVDATASAMRIAKISAYFLGKPYVDDALGEGKLSQFDQGPLYRTDAFDCVTYVSTVLALAQAQNLAQFEHAIVGINYQHPPIAFVNRNHFMSVDWNLVNQRNGYLKDITAQIVDDNHQAIATYTTIVINKPAWFAKLPLSRIHLIHAIAMQGQQQLLQQLHQLAAQVHPATTTLAYLPLNRLFKANGSANIGIFAQIPSGAVIEIVRPNWDLTQQIGTKMLISHLGLAIWTAQGLMFREASLIQHKVIDIPLISYLKNYRNSATIKGINVQQILLR